MREIKFRGKRVDNGEWVYGYYSACIERGDNGGVECYYRENETVLHYISDLEGNVHLVDPSTVGQHTGLKDKNGKEIYEGDIIKSIALSNDHHQRGAIIVSPVEYWFGNACLSITYVPIYPFCVNHELEVIGNIHDNPELLKE